ncbi:MAG: endonuclease/exonuclease/phosphatase family protein [Elusimicrobiales bacterium]|nr:endonuclease/exonuclease/phosphatase family protein [Elusimicrobiales bacterium]
MFYKQPQPEQTLSHAGRPARQTLPREFTVCAWNWQKSKCAGWAEEFNALAEAADVFLAQEVRLTPCVTTQLEQTPLYWTHAASFFSLKEQEPIGVATGAKTVPEQIWFKRGAREPFFKMPKMTLAVLLPLETGQKLLAVNVHAINFTGLKPFEQNLARAAELLLGFDGPVILGGDFNAWNQKRRNLLEDLARSARLTEVPFSPDTRTRCLGRTVDFLFTRGLKTLAAGVRCTDASDHNPLLARLILQ